MLEFHSEIEDYFDPTIPLQNFHIIIEFNSRPILQGEYRTIILEYIREVNDYSDDSGEYRFNFNLDDSPRTYISIRSLSSKFVFVKEPLILATDAAFRLENLWESESVTQTETENSIYFNSREFVDNCQFCLKFRHELSHYQRWWFNSGIVVGIVAVFLVPICAVVLIDPTIRSKNQISTIIIQPKDLCTMSLKSKICQ